jgi:hypothetical protein
MTDGQLASLSWCQATIRARDQFFFLLDIFFRQLQVCYFVAPCLRRGRVCNLLLLLVLATAVPLGSALSNERSGLSFIRKVLHNIVIEFGVPMKLVRLIKVCSNETYSKVRIGKHLSDSFPIQNGLKQGDALSPLLLNFALEYAIRRSRKTRWD